MLSLFDIQNHFKNSVIQQQNNRLNQYIIENNISADQRLQIYRNNVFITLTETLQSIYPTIQKLVGEEFFSAIAYEYIKQHLPISGNLHDYGNYFAKFLFSFPHAQSLPYLPEVAQLEWAYHEVFHESNANTFDLKKLEAIPIEQHNHLKFKLNPASRLFTFDHPVLTIWQFCQQNSPTETLDINTDGEKILIIRRQLDVSFKKLTDGEFCLLSALNTGLILEQACAYTLQAEPEFNIPLKLQEYILHGMIVDFYLD